MRNALMLVICLSFGLLQADGFIVGNCAQNAGSIVSIALGTTIAALCPLSLQD